MTSALGKGARVGAAALGDYGPAQIFAWSLLLHRSDEYITIERPLQRNALLL
ncbi:MAG: hypothetical protein HY232_10185 [Acidobacteria bacterium]|nr:hypothetical protein [Acidobacteriota bacterium]